MSVNDIGRTMLREVRIAQRGVRLYFTPHRPINAMAHFRGRYREVERCVRALLTPGQHIVIFGERGVGKSSLANVACDLLLAKLKGKVYTFLCSGRDTFSDVWSGVLGDLGFPGLLAEQTFEKTEGGAAQLKLLIAEAGVDTYGTTTQRFVPSGGAYLTPSVVAEFLEQRDVLVVIDEVERLSSDKDRELLAETIKQLSDRDAEAKILLVGIAQVPAEIVASHPSIGRCLLEIHLLPMAPDEIRDIIVEGADKCDLVFEADVIDAIVEMAAGYPYFAHLLGLKCAEEAVADDVETVDGSILETAINGAVQDAEGALRDAYLNAVRSHTTSAYVNIVTAAAHIGLQEFTAAELRQAIKDHADQDMNQASLNNYFDRLVAEDDSAILRRVAKGVYRFADPRMPAFVRIVEQSTVTPSQAG